LDNSRGDGSRNDSRLSGGGGGNGSGNLRRSGRDSGRDSSGDNGSLGGIRLSRGLGDRGGGAGVLGRQLGDSSHVASGGGLLDLLGKFSGERGVLSERERRGKPEEGGDDQGPSFHFEETNDWMWSGTGLC